MDIYEELKQDHREVADLLASIDERTRLDDRLESLFLELKQNVELHMWVEEKFFYPLLKDEAESADEALEAYEEHRVVKKLLEELDNFSLKDEEWHAKFTVLKENIEHHVEEEENELFTQAKKVLTSDQAVELGGQIATEKASQKALK